MGKKLTKKMDGAIIKAQLKIQQMKDHLKNQDGDENVKHTILLVAAFVVGAIIIGILVLFFGTKVKTWLDATGTSWFKTTGTPTPSGL